MAAINLERPSMLTARSELPTSNAEAVLASRSPAFDSASFASARTNSASLNSLFSFTKATSPASILDATCTWLLLLVFSSLFLFLFLSTSLRLSLLPHHIPFWCMGCLVCSTRALCLQTPQPCSRGSTLGRTSTHHSLLPPTILVPQALRFPFLALLWASLPHIFLVSCSLLQIHTPLESCSPPGAPLALLKLCLALLHFFVLFFPFPLFLFLSSVLPLRLYCELVLTWTSTFSASFAPPQLSLLFFAPPESSLRSLAPPASSTSWPDGLSSLRPFSSLSFLGLSSSRTSSRPLRSPRSFRSSLSSLQQLHSRTSHFTPLSPAVFSCLSGLSSLQSDHFLIRCSFLDSCHIFSASSSCFLFLFCCSWRKSRRNFVSRHLSSFSDFFLLVLDLSRSLWFSYPDLFLVVLDLPRALWFSFASLFSFSSESSLPSCSPFPASRFPFPLPFPFPLVSFAWHVYTLSRTRPTLPLPVFLPSSSSIAIFSTMFLGSVVSRCDPPASMLDTTGAHSLFCSLDSSPRASRILKKKNPASLALLAPRLLPNTALVLRLVVSLGPFSLHQSVVWFH